MTYRITPENLIYHTLIGLETVVADSTNPDMIDITGAVVDETRNTLVINPCLQFFHNDFSTRFLHKKSSENCSSDRKSAFDQTFVKNLRAKTPLRAVFGHTSSDNKKHSKQCQDSFSDKIIPKSHTIFIFSLPDGSRVRVNGDRLVARPEDRIAKKHRNN